MSLRNPPHNPPHTTLRATLHAIGGQGVVGPSCGGKPSIPGPSHGDVEWLIPKPLHRGAFSAAALPTPSAPAAMLGGLDIAALIAANMQGPR
ncbi:hypothetical protein B0H12DRAFT_1241346 [Mycena haematopus]|nr:hypothetical protein B0H12DRAFT_1241346 [Mycena haematopus]